jgi:hypothetical protein
LDQFILLAVYTAIRMINLSCVRITFFKLPVCTVWKIFCQMSYYRRILTFFQFKEFIPFFFFWWHRGLNLASCLLGRCSYLLEPLRQPFFVMAFFEIGSWELFAQGWLWIVILLISASWVTRITNVSHWYPAKDFILISIPEPSHVSLLEKF